MGPRAEANIIRDRRKERNQRGKGGLGKGDIMKAMYKYAAFEHIAFYANFKLIEAGL